jgi:hypothetical protein
MGPAQPKSKGGAKTTAAAYFTDAPEIAIDDIHTYAIANGTAQLTILTILACRLFNSSLPYHKKPHPIIHTMNATMAKKLAT